MKKQIFFTIKLFFIVLFLSNCEKDKINPIIGKWKVNTVKGVMSIQGQNINLDYDLSTLNRFYTFNQDGSLISAGNIIIINGTEQPKNNNGTYTVSGSNITFSYANDTNEKITQNYIYSVVDGKLVLKFTFEELKRQLNISKDPNAASTLSITSGFEVTISCTKQ